ncbi:hypothetical protein U27_00576 [Candidatus Vecturithrix granuli]|uniref:Uncharacterized protein n=1 Tax=Vecturithrix granuli TaxID=1499967 RepID=A0A081C7X3_VECG1|nr:hypothetical protein U27_00576 [Candidatus Vecturithrix granuli]
MFAVYCGWWLNQTPVHLASRKFQLAQTWAFVLTYFGNLFTTRPEQAAEFGVAGMFVFVIVGLMVLYSGLRKYRIVFLRLGIGLICMLYAIINILATSRMRNDALELRYASISLIFWLGGAIAVFMLIRSLDVIFPERIPIIYLKKRLSLVFWIALLLFVIYPMYHESIPKLNYIHKGFQDQRLAILSLQLELYDTEVLYTKISIAPSQVMAIVPLMKKTHHVPFDHLLIPEYEYDKVLEPDRISQNGCTGQFAAAIELEHDIFQVQGENLCPIIKYILIANEALHLRGGAIPMQQDQPHKVTSDDSVSKYVRWQGYAKLESQERTLIAYAVLPDDHFVPLGRYEKQAPK